MTTITALVAAVSIAAPQVAAASELVLPPDLAKAIAPKSAPVAPLVLPAVVAQETPAPQPSQSPVDITSLVKHSNPNFNPCGGWRQMLVSYAPATNCVFDAGEFAVAVNYAATYVPANTILEINGTPVTTTTHANTHAYPAFPLGFGLGGRWQFSYTPPEHTDVFGYNGNINKSGTTNQVFSFRNMWFFNRCFTYCGGDGLSAILLTYEPPTGSPDFRGIGPRYTVAFSTTVAVQKSPSGKGRILINLYDPITYSVVSSTPGEASTPGHVQWGWSSTWLATMIWIHHSWRLNTSIGWMAPAHQWVWNINPNYLLSRRLVMGINFGGGNISVSNPIGAPPTYINAHNQVVPRFLDFTVSYLIGHTIPLIKGMPATDLPGD